MSLKNRFHLVKVAVQKLNTSNNLHEAYIGAYNKISVLESEYEMPNQILESALGKEICQIKYVPEDWLGMISEQSGETVVHNCHCFNGQKCQNANCATQPANHAYFDALRASEEAKDVCAESWKRVFRIKAK